MESTNREVGLCKREVFHQIGGECKKAVCSSKGVWWLEDEGLFSWLSSSLMVSVFSLRLVWPEEDGSL